MKHKIHLYGDNINTDLIIASRHLTNFLSEEALASFALENLDKEFAGRVKKGDVLVAGKNFGCGSSREEAVAALKGSKISAVIADSFGRTFFRNCINSGTLRILECPGISEACKGKGFLEFDVEKGTISVEGSKTLRIPPQPPVINEILRAGGLLKYIALKTEEEKA
jgi:3-isopropylmalate/(R)-2-methylmalate dehydratase small subunit